MESPSAHSLTATTFLSSPVVLRRPPSPSGRGLAFSREQLQQLEKSEGGDRGGRVRERIVNEVETESTEYIVSEYMRIPQYACFDVVLIHNGRGFFGLCSSRGGDTATTRRIAHGKDPFQMLM